MKRVGQLFEQILDRDNLLRAVWKSLRGKRNRPEARQYLQRLDDELTALADGLRNETYPIGRFQQFRIHDPKERIITAPCFAERVLHHAIMNVCEPHFDRWLIADTFACRPNKGRSAALQRAGVFSKRYRWYLSMDVRKYFDSISHAVLLRQLRCKFKDRPLLRLLERIVTSFRGEQGIGLPIGSLCSQHLANFYLNPLDRLVKETLRAAGYVRYMDDFVLWGDGPDQLQGWQNRCRELLADQLSLSVKPSPVINRCQHGLGFLGIRQFPTHRILNRRSRIRFRRKLVDLNREHSQGNITDNELQRRSDSLIAFARGDGVSSWNFRRRVVNTLAVNGLMARTA